MYVIMLYYSCIGHPVRTRKKTIYRETERATADLNIRMKALDEAHPLVV